LDGGNVTIVSAYDYAANNVTPATTLFASAPAGYTIPVQIALVKATGTSSTALVGFGPK
jgi:hypothetical protein